MQFIKAHWALIALIAGAYAALATALIRKIPMPASGWKRFLHRLLLDWPAALPALDMKGILGLPFNVPYLSLSQAASEVIGQVLKMLLPLAFVLSCSSCAQYSACVKAQTTPTFQALTAQTVETQVIGLIDLGIDEAWLQLGLQAAQDACTDTNCKALVACVAVAWQQAHPATSSAKAAVANRAIDAFKAKQPAAYLYRCNERPRLTLLDMLPPVCESGEATCREVVVDDDVPELRP